MKVFIENASGSKIKKIYNEKTFELIDSYLINSPYPFASGFIIGTEDILNKCLDCYIISRKKLMDGMIIECITSGLFEYAINDKMFRVILVECVDEVIPINDMLVKQFEAFFREIFRPFSEIKVDVGRLLNKEFAEILIKSRLLK